MGITFLVHINKYNVSNGDNYWQKKIKVSFMPLQVRYLWKAMGIEMEKFNIGLMIVGILLSK